MLSYDSPNTPWEKLVHFLHDVFCKQEHRTNGSFRFTFHVQDWYDSWHGKLTIFLFFATVFLLLLSIYLLIKHRRKIIRKVTEMDRKDRIKYKVIIHLVGYKDDEIIYGELYFPPIPERKGYVFNGWFLDSALTIPYVSNKKIKKEMALYPKWVRQTG